MGPTTLIPLARTTTRLDSIRTKITTIGSEGISIRIHAMELRTHKSYKKHDTSRFLKGKEWYTTSKSKLSVNYLGVRVSMPRNIVQGGLWFCMIGSK